MTERASQVGEVATSSFKDIVDNYEQLIKTTQQELDLYKKEQAKLKTEVVKILHDNQTINAELQNLRLPLQKEPTEEHVKLTNDAITNLKNQIRQLNEERNTIHALWKTSQETINTLEKEISNYRDQLLKPNPVSEIKKKYTDTIQILENTITTLRRELGKQSNINKELCQSKQLTEQRLKEFEDKCLEQEQLILKYKNLENINTNLRNQLNHAMRTNSEFEKSLKVAKQLIEERFCREKEALQKVQEALQVAEHAMAEKQEAINKEKIIREECNNLAKTIGQVMEDAANKVEKNLENMKLQYEKDRRLLKDENQQMKNSLENQKKLTHLAEVRGKTVENKLKEVIQENVVLDADLQVASQAIIELELKLEAIEHLVDKDKKSKKICDEKEEAIIHFLQNNKLLKERWKAAIEEVTKKFHEEITTLHNENTALKMEIQELKLKCMQK